MTADGQDRPYQPSWVDRLTDWVAALSIREWTFYAGLGLVLILIQVLFLWLDGGMSVAEVLLPVLVANALLIPFGLALTHFLDRQALIALDSMKPALEMTEPEFIEIRYKISNMPSRPPLIAGLIVLVMLILMEWLVVAPVRFTALEELRIFAVVFQIIDKSTAFVYGAFIYHTVRQLRLVNAINSNHVRVSLFNLTPLQAFSKLTASTAVGLVAGMFGWLLINPDLLADPVSLGIAGAFTLLAVGIFVWPLYGAHRLIEMEKARALHEIDFRFEAVFSRFNQLAQDDDYAATERLSGTIASMEIQHRRISDIPTWPWRSETARIALTAIALPLILMILQYFVLQALGR